MRSSNAGRAREARVHRRKADEIPKSEAWALARRCNQTLRDAVNAGIGIQQAQIHQGIRFWQALRRLNDLSFAGVTTADELKNWSSAYCDFARAQYDKCYVEIN